MTVPEKPTSARPRSLQEDLLADLQGAVPPPAPRPGSGRGRTTPAALPSRRTPREAPTVELQLTRTRWASPSVRSVPGRSGLVLSAGPLRVSLSLLGR